MILLRLVADLVLRRRLLLAALILVSLVLAALSLGRGILHIDTDYLALLPDKMTEARVLRETVKDFGSLDYLVVLVESEDSIENHLETLDRLADSLRESPLLNTVEYKVDTSSPLVRFMAERSLLFLSGAEREQLKARLSLEGIKKQIKKDRQILATPTSAVMKRFILLDPLDILGILKHHFVSGRSTFGIDLSAGYYLGKEGRSALLIAKPVRPAQDVSFCQALLADLSRRSDSILEEPDDDGELTIRYGGGYVVVLEDYKILKKDAAVNFSMAFLSVLAVFAFGLGSLRTIKYAALPLAAGVLLAGGFGALALGSFNPATSGFAALLLGLGIDYVIVMYGRFSEERRRGRPTEEAIRAVIERTGKGVLLGAITSAATFLALCVVDFRGLYQLGLLTGCGILLCFLAAVTILPLLLARDAEQHHEALAKPPKTLGVERLSLLARRAPRSTIAIGTLLAILSLFAIPRIRFDDNLKNLRAKGNKGIEVQSLVAERFGGGFDYLMVINRAEDLDTLLGACRSLDRKLDGLVDDGVLAAYDSVVRYLPPISLQEKSLDWLRAERRGGLDPVEVRTRVEEELAKGGFRVEKFRPAIARVVALLSVDEPLTPQILARHKLGFVIDRYIRKTGSGVKAVTYVYPRAGTFKRHVPPALLDLARNSGGHIQLTGVTVISQALREAVRQQAIFALILGVVLVLTLLAVFLRSLAESLFVMVPLAAGILWMCGLISLLDMSFNFFNVFVATMILGIGVDYGIHATRRYLEDGKMDFDGAFLQTGKSIVLSAFTTMLGFGSFATSHYRGLYSIGVVAIIGTGTCLIASLTVLPALLVLRRPPPTLARDRSAPDPDEETGLPDDVESSAPKRPEKE